MLTIYDQIQELRAELNGCALTRAQRADAVATLTRLIAEQSELDRAFAACFTNGAPPG